jgi:hypothetical protein
MTVGAAAGVLASLAIVAAARAAPPEHELRVPAEVDAEVGRGETVSLTIAPAAGRRIDADGPLLVTLAVEPADAVDLPRRRYGRREAADQRAEAPRFDLRYTARLPGDHRLRVVARFWVCRRHACRPVREERSVVVHARAPAPPPDAPPATSSPAPAP